MFAKLLKYDFKSVKRFGVPMLLAMLGATVLGCISLVMMVFVVEGIEYDPDGVISAFAIMGLGLLLMLAIFVLFAGITGTQLTVYVDFYKSLVSDEGYLTFTLPVRPRQILGSKLLNGSIWNAIVLAVTIVCILAMIFSLVTAVWIFADTGSTPEEEEPVARPDPTFGELINTVLLVILLILSLIASAVNSQLLYFMAIFFASVIVKKNKALTAVGCVMGAYFIYGMLGNTFSLLFTFSSSATSLLLKNPLLVMNISMAIFIAFLSGLSVLFFKATEYMMEKKLNLA